MNRRMGAAVLYAGLIITAMVVTLVLNRPGNIWCVFAAGAAGPLLEVTGDTDGGLIVRGARLRATAVLSIYFAAIFLPVLLYGVTRRGPWLVLLGLLLFTHLVAGVVFLVMLMRVVYQ